jgi:hypothetical protein
MEYITDDSFITGEPLCPTMAPYSQPNERSGWDFEEFQTEMWYNMGMDSSSTGLPGFLQA